MSEEYYDKYSVSHELRDIAEKIKSKYYDYVGHADLNNIYFAEINTSKPKKSKVMQVSGVSSAWVKQLMLQDKKTLYCIAVYGEDWDNIDQNAREWLIFDALLMISPANDGKLIKPDVNEFGILVEYLGPYWRTREELPSLLKSVDPLPIPLPKDDTDEGSSCDFGDE